MYPTVGMSVTMKLPNLPPASLTVFKFSVSMADFRSANLISGTAEGEEQSNKVAKMATTVNVDRDLMLLTFFTLTK